MLVIKLFGVSPVFFSGVLRFVAHPSLLLVVFSLIGASFLTSDPSPVSDQRFGPMIIRQVPFPLFPPLLFCPSLAVQFGPGAQLVDMLAVILALLFSFLSAIHDAMIAPGERLCIHPLDQSGDRRGVYPWGGIGPIPPSFALTSMPFVLAFRLLFHPQWFVIPRDGDVNAPLYKTQLAGSVKSFARQSYQSYHEENSLRRGELLFQ